MVGVQNNRIESRKLEAKTLEQSSPQETSSSSCNITTDKIKNPTHTDFNLPAQALTTPVKKPLLQNLNTGQLLSIPKGTIPFSSTNKQEQELTNLSLPNKPTLSAPTQN